MRVKEKEPHGRTPAPPRHPGSPRCSSIYKSARCVLCTHVTDIAQQRLPRLAAGAAQGQINQGRLLCTIHPSGAALWNGRVGRKRRDTAFLSERRRRRCRPRLIFNFGVTLCNEQSKHYKQSVNTHTHTTTLRRKIRARLKDPSAVAIKKLVTH